MPLPYPTPSSAQVSDVMRRIRRVDTKPELQLRSLLHRRGYRFRKDFPLRAGEVRVRADIAFTRWRVAVFVDGCFFHCCPVHFRLPKSNVDYWKPKLERNVRRDRLVTAALQEGGWTVVRLWEHVPVEEAAEAVAEALFGVGRS